MHVTDFGREEVWYGRRRQGCAAAAYVLKPEAERALKPLASFRECAKDCPEMIVIPAGGFTMGSPATEQGRYTNEGPEHEVTIAKPFAVSKFDVRSPTGTPASR
jgi:formylglycine-generating enzyme required for sulfatase activity